MDPEQRSLTKYGDMTDPMQEQVVLITGCSSGFGELIARTLAEGGHYVFATMRGVKGRNEAAATALAEWGRTHNLKLDVLEMDVTEDESVNDAVAEAMSRAGRIDVVVNNAGA